MPNTASLVYWEGILDIAGFFFFAGFGFLGDLGIIPGVFGIVGLLIGLVYLIGLPKTLNITAANLLLDRVAARPVSRYTYKGVLNGQKKYGNPFI